MKLRTHMAGLLLALAAAVLVSIVPAAAQPFRLIVTHLEPPLVPNGVMDLAVELGYFEREGVEVELIRVQQTPSALASILAGEGDMANVGVDGVLQLVAQGDNNLKAVTSPNKALPFLIAAKSEITSPAELVGRSFGVGRVGSLDHSLSTQVLANAGVSMDSMEVVSLGQPGVRGQALAAGQIDATTMSIGVWLSIPDKSGLSILIPQDVYFAGAPVVNKVNVVTTDVLASRRDDVEAVLTALTKISRDFAANPSAWAEAMAPYGGNLSAEELQQLADSFAGSWSVNGGMNRTELQTTQDWVYATEDFQGVAPVSLDDWVDFSVMDDVLADLGVDPSADQPGR